MKGIKKPNDPQRDKVYRDWRMKLGYGACTDVDQIEWTPDGRPLAVIELTKRDDLGFPPPKAFFDAILERYEKEMQGDCALTVANALGVKAWIVCFTDAFDEIYVWNLTDKRGWWKIDLPTYTRFIKGLAEAVS